MSRDVLLVALVCFLVAFVISGVAAFAVTAVLTW